MNIEIIEFYPVERDEEKNRITGTIRIKLVDLGIHLLGIWVVRENGRFFFSLPGRNSTHHVTKEIIRYPFISFENKELNKALMAQIHLKAPEFIERRLNDKENPLVFHPKQFPSSTKTEHQRTNENATEAKKTASIDVPDHAKNKRIKTASSFDKKCTNALPLKARNHSLHGGNKKSG